MDEFFAVSAAGKVLDASAVAAWASGHLGMQTWFSIAWELQLSFYLPAFARSEAMLLYPATEPLIETWPGCPTSCSQTRDPPTPRPSMRLAAGAGYQRAAPGGSGRDGCRGWRWGRDAAQ